MLPDKHLMRRYVSSWAAHASLLLVLLLPFNSVAVANGTIGPTPNTAESVEKYALVIGNSNYTGFRGSLRNPANDAKLMAQSLLKLGFEVKHFTDLNRTGMVNAVSDFAATLPPGATALVYYAGHGMQIGGLSYLVPVDMSVTSEQSVPLRAYSVKTLLEKISSAPSSVNVLVFDACRDNPFQPAPPVRYRNFANLGLAPIQAPRGTVVAYSTAPGQLAADGNARNSFYTAVLSKVILEQGLALEDIFKKVGNEVRRKTSDDQIPWFESSLTEEYFFLPPSGVTVVAGRPLKRESGDVAVGTVSRNIDLTSRATDVLWYRSMSDVEWASLDRTVQQRAHNTKTDEIPKLKHQADGGSVVAQTALGKVLQGGADPQAAIPWFQKAADAGFPIAQLALGDMHSRGQGVSPDQQQARQWIELAAKANYPKAQLRLLTLAIEEKRVNPQAVGERLIELEHKVRMSGEPGNPTGMDEPDSKDRKQEHSAMLRKELAQRGQKWSNSDFGDALMNGDLETVQMYLDAGWNPLSFYEEGNALAHFIWRAGHLDGVVIEAMLKLFVEHGVDPNAPVLKFRGLAPSSMALNAVHACNSVALAQTIRLGAIVGTITDAIQRNGTVHPPGDGGVDCPSQIAKIGASLKLQFRCGPTAWDRSRNTCELF
jgi:TPR repeat protein